MLVLKWLTSIALKLLHPLNMLAMLVTSLVFRYSIPVMSSKNIIPANQLYVFFGRAEAKDGSNTTLLMFEYSLSSGIYHSGPIFIKKLLDSIISIP